MTLRHRHFGQTPVSGAFDDHDPPVGRSAGDPLFFCGGPPHRDIDRACLAKAEVQDEIALAAPTRVALNFANRIG